MSVVVYARQGDDCYLVADKETTWEDLRYNGEPKVWFYRDRWFGFAGDQSAITRFQLRVQASAKLSDAKACLHESLVKLPKDLTLTVFMRDRVGHLWFADNAGAVENLGGDTELFVLGAGASYVYGFLDATPDYTLDDIKEAVRRCGKRVAGVGGVHVEKLT